MLPENLISKIPLNNSSLVSKNALLNAIQISSVFRGSSFYIFVFFSSKDENTCLISCSKYWGNLFLRYVETSLPY